MPRTSRIYATCPICGKELKSYIGKQAHMKVHRRKWMAELGLSVGESVSYINSLGRAVPVVVLRVEECRAWVRNPAVMDDPVFYERGFTAWPEDLRRA